MNDNPKQQTLISPVWLLEAKVGGKAVPSVLKFANGRLALASDEEVIFDEPISSLEKLSFPNTGYGIFTVKGKKYRLMFYDVYGTGLAMGLGQISQGVGDVVGSMAKILGNAGDIAALKKGLSNMGDGENKALEWAEALKFTNKVHIAKRATAKSVVLISVAILVVITLLVLIFG